MPTGESVPANMEDYLSFPKVFACGGSWMVKKDLVQAGAFDRITELCRQAVQKLAEIRHVKGSYDGGNYAPAVDPEF